MNHPEFDFPQSVFLDETALIAFMNSEDEHYSKARSLFLDLDDLDRKLVTTNNVIFAAHDWLRNHSNYGQAESFLSTMDQAAELGKLHILPGNSQLEKEAKQLLIERPDYHFSLDEAFTSVIVMTCGIKRVFSFNPNYSMLQKLDPEIKVIPSAW